MICSSSSHSASRSIWPSRSRIALRAHAAAEVLAPAERRAEAVLELAEDGLVGDHVLDLHVLELRPDVLHPLDRVIEVGLGVGDLGVHVLARLALELRPVFLVQLLRRSDALGPDLVVLGELRALVARLDELDPALERLAQLLQALLLVGLVAVEDLVDFLLELRQVLCARLLVDRGDDRCGEVEDLLELLRSHVDQVADPRGNALEEPDVGDRRGEVDVRHALAADLRAGDLDAAALADDALVADPLVLAAVALPVLGRTEDALAEEPVLLGLQRAVVDRLGLGDLAGGPAPDLLRGGEADLDCVEVVDVHLRPSFLLTRLTLVAGSLVPPSWLLASPSPSSLLVCSSAASPSPARTPERSMPSSSAARSSSSSSSSMSDRDPPR